MTTAVGDHNMIGGFSHLMLILDLTIAAETTDRTSIVHTVDTVCPVSHQLQAQAREDRRVLRAHNALP